MSLDASSNLSAEEKALKRHLNELLSITAYSKDPREINAHGTGTVLCIVNFPKTDGRDCNNFARFQPRYMVRIPHDRLVATASPKIMMMLEPTRQQRTRNRYQDVLDGVDGVDYVLDFTPPDNDEAADLMTSLWLPPGTKIWWAAGHYIPDHHLTAGPFGVVRPMADKPVGAVLTLGHDDNCKCYHNGNNIEDLWSPAKNITVPGIYPGHHVPWYRNIEGYCKTRHCMCIIRILRAIAGEDLLINSATRMWTVAKLAIHSLEVPNVVRDAITQWFTAQPNSKFIEMFPEEAFELALGLKMSDVLIASFKILVNERAVELAAPVRSPDKPRTTWAGRLRESYGDMPEDPVEHAAQAMADRLKATLDRMLQSLDNLDVLEWIKLKYFGLQINQSAQGVVQGAQTELLDAYNLLVSGFEEVFKSIIREALAEENPVPNPITGGRIQAQRAHSAPVDQPLPALYNLLHDYQRVCLPFFWAHLEGGLPQWDIFKFRRHEGCSLDELANHFNGLLNRAVSSRSLNFNREEFCQLFDESSPDDSEIYKFNLACFDEQLKNRLSQIASQVLGLPASTIYNDSQVLGLPATSMYNDRSEEKFAIDFLVSDHLLTHLEESELKFLPLWAGGNDDGTGGVFQPELPPAVLGATQPGPLYHTRHADRSDTDGRTAGYTNTDSSFSDLGMDNLDLDRDYATTVAGASNEPQYSHDSTIPPNGVMAMSTSIPSETFTENGDVAYAEAFYAQPADHQPLGQALPAYMEDDSDRGGNNDQDGGSVDWDPDSQDDDADSQHDDADSIASESTVSMGNFSHDDDDGDFDMMI